MSTVDPDHDPEDVDEEPDGTGENPHPMGPHGDPEERLVAEPQEDFVLAEGEAYDDRG